MPCQSCFKKYWTKPYSWSKHGEFQEIWWNLIVSAFKRRNSWKFKKFLHPKKNTPPQKWPLEPPKTDKVSRCFSFSKGHQFLFCLRTRLTGDQDRSYNETEISFGPFSSAERTTVWTMSIQTDDYWTTHFSLISKVDTCDMKWLHDWRCSRKMMPGNGKVIEPNCYQNHRAHRESSSISLLPSKPVYVKVAALGACNMLNIKTKMFRQRD